MSIPHILSSLIPQVFDLLHLNVSLSLFPLVFNPRVPFLLCQIVWSSKRTFQGICLFESGLYSMFGLTSLPYPHLYLRVIEFPILTFIIKTTTDLESPLCASALLNPPDCGT